jgi:hypothetical protein
MILAYTDTYNTAPFKPFVDVENQKENTTPAIPKVSSHQTVRDPSD